MSEELKRDYFLMPSDPGPCPLCGATSAHFIYYDADSKTPRASWAVDCDACGPFGIIERAARLLKTKPKATSAIREQLQFEHARGVERPLISPDMVEYFNAGGQVG